MTQPRSSRRPPAPPPRPPHREASDKRDDDYTPRELARLRRRVAARLAEYARCAGETPPS